MFIKDLNRKRVGMVETLTITKLAKKLGYTRQTIHNKLKNDEFPIPPIVGIRPRRWLLKDVEKWLKNNGT